MHSDPRYLMIDLDDEPSARKFLDRYEWARREMENRNYYVTEIKSHVSRSSGGVHVLIGVNNQLPPSSHLIIQSALGSDTTRDFLSLMRIMDGTHGSDPRMLFKPKNGKTVIGWIAVSDMIRKTFSC